MLTTQVNDMTYSRKKIPGHNAARTEKTVGELEWDSKHFSTPTIEYKVVAQATEFLPLDDKTT